MQGHIRSFVLSLGLLVGCTESRSPDRDAAPDAEACDGYQDEADALLSAGEACQQDDDCAAIGIDAPCLNAFLCPAALNRTADIDHLRAEASRLSSAYRACTRACSIASCVSGADAPTMCNPFTHRCEIRLLR